MYICVFAYTCIVNKYIYICIKHICIYGPLWKFPFVCMLKDHGPIRAHTGPWVHIGPHGSHGVYMILYIYRERERERFRCPSVPY